MKPNDWSDRIVRALDHIHANLEADLDPEALATVADFSLHHFHRVFRGMVGESVMGYVRRLRLERAAFRLKHGRSEILPLALGLGYESHEAFTRAFRNHFGMPPSAYRDASRETSAAGAEIRVEPARPVLVVAHVGSYEGVGAAWATLAAEVVARGLPALGPALGCVHDDPEITPPARCRYGAAWPLVSTEGLDDLPTAMSTKVIPGGRFATALHVGPYREILATYVGLLGRFLPRHGGEPADEPVIERYLDAPGTVPEEQLRTEVAVRLV